MVVIGYLSAVCSKTANVTGIRMAFQQDPRLIAQCIERLSGMDASVTSAALSINFDFFLGFQECKSFSTKGSSTIGLGKTISPKNGYMRGGERSQPKAALKREV